MRRLFLAALLLLASTLHAQTLGPVDWIFLVDTSKSMRGAGGTKDIWTDVKVSLDSFVREAGEHDSVTLYAFDSDVREIEAASRGDLYRAILTLPAEGKRTHLGAAIAEGLARAESLRRDSTDAARRQVVVLFTDGKEDVKGIEDPVPIAASVDRVGKSFVFFVSMGDHERQLDDFKGATVLRAPTAEAIRNLASEIRAKIPPPPPVPLPVETTTTISPPPPPPPEPPSPWLRASKIFVAIAVLALIAFLMLQNRRKQNRLEGELEILRPRAAPDVTFVGLPQLQATEVALSAVLPVDALAGSDARLFVRRKAGRKKVWIAATGGSLRVNDVETPISELFDADTIEIGDAKLRFNRFGDERPVETNQEGDL
jgi:uncharacterized protein YegL